MVALLFPENPIVGQWFTATNNIVYEWNGVTWIVIGSGNQGNYFLPTASTSVLGGVKIDGTTVTITDGIISASGTSGTVSYTPATPADWNGTAPTTIQEAIDRLAIAFKILNSGTGA
jgi:hypothetical protein